MKIKQSTDGGILIHLTEIEVQEIIKASKQPILFDEANQTQASINPYKGLEKKTRAFLEDVRKQFNQNWFDPADPIMQHFRKKHFILDVSPIWKRLEGMQAIECEREGTTAHVKTLRFLI